MRGSIPARCSTSWDIATSCTRCDIPSCARPLRWVLEGLRERISDERTEAERAAAAVFCTRSWTPNLAVATFRAMPMFGPFGGEADIARAPEAGFLLCIHGIGLMAGTIGLEIIISGRAADVSDLTEPSEARRRRADGIGQARRSEPVQLCTLRGFPARVRFAIRKFSTAAFDGLPSASNAASKMLTA